MPFGTNHGTDESILSKEASKSLNRGKHRPFIISMS
jgi:hypothetical protein